MKKLILIPCLLMLCITSAQIRLPRLVRDSMILQRDEPVNIWGWASPKEKVSISFKNKTYKATADAAGKWSVKLPAVKAGGPYSITISGRNKIILNEILFGDVWFCSGQSNMVHQLNIHDVTYAKDIATANDPDIRQFWVPNTGNLQGPQQDLNSGYWVPAVGEQVRPFSAVAYFFAKDIHDRYHIPVGIINASIGGTPAEAWTSEEGLKDFPNYLSVIQKNKDTAYVNGAARSAGGFRRNPPADAGLTGTIKWFDPSYQPKGWRPINIPGFWEDQGIKDLNGIVWYRREMEIPPSMAGKAAKVWLGRIVDADELYINGKSIGTTGYQYPQRRYTVPADLLKPGKNLFVIRVTNTNGKGGFVPDKPYCIFSGNDTVDLKGTWQYKVGEVYEPFRPGGGAGNFTPPVNVPNQPAALYNAMVAPLTSYNIKGVLWYQGESNTNRSAEYAKLLPALIADWRKQFRQDSLPFLYPQLPGFMDYNYSPSESSWAQLRESQRKTLSVPKTAMAVTIDLGEWNDIHPDNKKDVGLRLALGARKLVYGENMMDAGPLFHSAEKKEGKMIISFTHTGSGLTTTDGESLSEFSIAGSDKKFVWAKAQIDGDKIVVWSETVKDPQYVRYAWADNPVNPNLCNKEKLPASPFSTE